LGAGPVPGLRSFGQVRGNPLPSETPSPELGAGPGLISAATVPQKMLPKTKSSIAIPTIFFNFFSSSYDIPNIILSLILGTLWNKRSKK
jgi:hypothetical protein